MAIERYTCEAIKLIFSLEDGEDVKVVLGPLVDAIEEYQMILGPAATGTHIDSQTLAMLAMNTKGELPERLKGLKKGDAIHSKMHSRDGIFLRPGPCGWAVCDIEGRRCLCNPMSLVVLDPEDEDDFDEEETDDAKPKREFSRPRDAKGRLLPKSALAGVS